MITLCECRISLGTFSNLPSNNVLHRPAKKLFNKIRKGKEKELKDEAKRKQVDETRMLMYRVCGPP